MALTEKDDKMSRNFDSTSGLSLIVCTVRRYAELERLFSSLGRQTFPAFEIVLVDQNDLGFLDALVQRFRAELRITHVRSEHGLSRARNVGLRYAEFDIIAFPDDDCWYREDTLKRVITLFERNPQLDIVSGRTLDTLGRPSLSKTLATQAEITKHNVFLCGTSSGIFVRRSVIELVRGFDERLGVGTNTPFQSGEETDFVLRALSCECRGRYFPELIVHHDQIDAVITAKQIARARVYGAGFGALLRIHFGGGYFLFYVVRTLAATCLQIVRLRISQAQSRLEWLRGVVIGYFGWPGWTQSRRNHLMRRSFD